MAGNQEGELAASLLEKGEANEKMGIDEMLEKYAGELGPWQLRHFVLTNLAWALEAFHALVIIFSDREPAWQCIGDCARASSVCRLPAGSWEWVNGPGASTVSEWGLICGEKYKVGLVQSVFFVGCMIGCGVFGHLSDSLVGRKGCLVSVCIMNLFFGCLTALSPSYWAYLSLRFLTGISTGGLGLSAFVLSTEPIGPSKRGAAGMSTFYFFSFGIAVVAVLAYIFQSSWRHLYFATSLPNLFFLVLVVPFISESPRWYLIRGKTSQALRVMHSIAKTNGKKLPNEAALALDNNNDTDAGTGKVGEEEAVSGTLIDVVKSPVTRMRLILSVAINFLTSVVYYGLNLNVVNLGTNLYLNVALNGISEMPAFTLTAILIGRYGRKPLTVGTMWFSGLFCLTGSLLRGGGVFKVLRMACGILGIFGMAGTYNLLFVYTAELFPTVVRNAALGCTTQAGQMGAILAPLVVVLGGGFPFAVFGACGFIGGFLAFYLPETKNSRLYDTMTGIEEGEG